MTQQQRAASILDPGWWPVPAATAWVLSRNREFAEACNRIDEGYVIEGQVSGWRHDVPIGDTSLGRKPVMLFPTVASARAALVAKTWCMRTRGAELSAADVRAAFPALDHPDRARVLASVWRGVDPHREERVGLSHAAWWIASKGGTEVIILDAWGTWESAFKQLLGWHDRGWVPIRGVNPEPPWRPVPGEVDGVQIEYPCHASDSHRHGSGYEIGRNSFIACTIDPAAGVMGDRYFERGSKDPKWERLAVRSADLIGAIAAPTVWTWRPISPSVAPGPKAGESTPKRPMCDAAVAILKSGEIPRGRGRVTAIARRVHPEFPKYQLSTIEKYIRDIVREWEQENPEM